MSKDLKSEKSKQLIKYWQKRTLLTEKKFEIAMIALLEIQKIRYRIGGETEEAEIARRAIENIDSR